MTGETIRLTARTAWKRLKHGRILSQALIIGLMSWTGFQMVKGVPGATIEKYCPFGGMETLLPWLGNAGTLCSLSTINLSVFFGVLLITLLFKRVFCSHLCPVGAIAEWTAKLSRRFMIGARQVPPRVDRALKWLKYPILVLILYLTYQAKELVFREVDPFYVLFTAGQGHGLYLYSLIVVGLLFVFGFFVPMAFCRYVCPLAATLTPLSRIGIAKITRNEERCIDCGACDKACEWGLRPSEVKAVTSGECTNCQDCVRRCPVPDVLSLKIGRSR